MKKKFNYVEKMPPFVPLHNIFRLIIMLNNASKVYYEISRLTMENMKRVYDEIFWCLRHSRINSADTV